MELKLLPGKRTHTKYADTDRVLVGQSSPGKKVYTQLKEAVLESPCFWAEDGKKE